MDSGFQNYRPFSDNSGAPLQSWSSFEQSRSVPQDLGFPPAPTIDYNQGVINPSPNPAAWGGPDGFEKYKQAMQGNSTFRATFGLDGKKPDGTAENAQAGGSRPPMDSAPVTPESTADSSGAQPANISPAQMEQNQLKLAYESGGALVVSLGGQNLKDTDKLRETLKSVKGNEGDAFLYGDSNNLDSSLEMAKTAEQLKKNGLWDGDLPITFASKVEKNPDGTYSIGKPVATFLGGRAEIATILSDQMKYARRDTSRDGAPKEQGLQPAPSADAVPAVEGAGRENSGKQDVAAAAQWEKQLQESSGQQSSAAEFAQGWGKFIEREGVDNPSVRAVADAFGRELYSGQGKFDGAALKKLMADSKVSDQKEIDQALERVNSKLKDSGLKLQASFDSTTGKIRAMEMIGHQNGSVFGVSVDAQGNVSAFEVENGSRKQAGMEHVSLRLAKQAAADACP